MTSTTRRCSVEGCDRFHYGQNYCAMHYQRWKRLGDPIAGKTYGTRGEGHLINGGYPAIGRKMVHIAVAEKALGKPLPLGVQVHHVDGDKTNYKNSNLVICPDQEYHSLLHLRGEALDACGNPDWRRCIFCQEFDDIKNMRLHSSSTYSHSKCHSDQQLKRYAGSDAK